MLILYLLQATVPLALIIWLAFAPPNSTAGFWTQVLATGIGLLAISTTGIWTFPPWWVPYSFAVLLVAATISGVARRRIQTLWPQSVRGWISFAAFAALGLYAVNESRIAFAASQASTGRVFNLKSPLGPGKYLVANGGAAPSINAHAAFLDQSVSRRRPYWGTGHGVDLVAIDRWGLRADGVMPPDPARYHIYGRAIIAPCGGDVIAALDGLPDMEVPKADTAHLAGNHVILRCGDVHILLGHFQKGSLSVTQGQKLRTGEKIALAGNSGNSSEPHLHIHAQLPGTTETPFSGKPIPIRINGQYLVRNDRVDGSGGRGRPERP
jgi:murein DD-endopeptidase MepM/ murein hydrolase activator NlpD